MKDVNKYLVQIQGAEIQVLAKAPANLPYLEVRALIGVEARKINNVFDSSKYVEILNEGLKYIEIEIELLDGIIVVTQGS